VVGSWQCGGELFGREGRSGMGYYYVGEVLWGAWWEMVKVAQSWT